jgi:peptidyl-prolyl cis-trans isomerase B (cyclophilin B)
MKHLALPLLFSVPLAAQDPALIARLKPASEVARIGAEIEFTLVVDVKRPTEIDATVLAGKHLVSKVEDKDGPAIVELVEGRVKVGAGARIERKLSVRISDVPAKEGLVAATFRWPDLPGADCAVRLAPDSSTIDLDQLDYDKTRVLLVTNHGEMTLSFRPDKAPKHVRNFVKLSKEGFYDNTQFHRVMPGFMIQGGCPNTKPGASGMPGTGNPGYSVAAEFNDLRHVRGVLSMARSQDPNSAGSQFFIMHGENQGLDGQYSAFGKLETGEETLDRIVSVRLGPQSNGEPSRPLTAIHLHAALVLPVYKKESQR